MKVLVYLFLVSAPYLVIYNAYGQEPTDADSTRLTLITTLDKNEYLGTITFEDDQIIKLQTRNLGEITIQKNEIRDRKTIEHKKIVEGEIWLENPQATRYFWAPNGYGLKKGEGYYQNVWVLFNQVSVGITDHISLGGGLIPIFLFGGEATPVWITPKVSIPIKKDKFNLGAGAIAGTLIGEWEGGAGLLYGTGTLGSRDKNISFGLGYGFADGTWASTPVFNLGGMLRIGRRGYLLTENYYVNFEGDGGALIMLGGRSVLGNVTLDYGLVIPAFSSQDVFIAVPWLGLIVPFGQ